MNSTTKAVVAIVKFGYTQFEGLMLPDGTFAIGVSQLENLKLVNQSNASRDVKALLGNDFQLTKHSSELNPKPVNVISLEAFELLLLRLDRKGNKAAQDLRDQLVGLSLYQLFSDAFGIELQARDRSQWLRDRQDGIKMRWGFTDAIEDYCSRNNVSDNYLKFIYPNVSDKLNRLLFGKSAKELCKDYDCPKSALRNQFNSEEILDIRRLEEYAMRLIDRDNVEPLRALETAYAFWKS